MLKKLLKQTFHMTQKSQIKQPLSPFLSRAVTGTKESAKHAENVIAYFDFFHSVEHKKIFFFLYSGSQWGTKQHWKESKSYRFGTT